MLEGYETSRKRVSWKVIKRITHIKVIQLNDFYWKKAFCHWKILLNYNLYNQIKLPIILDALFYKPFKDKAYYYELKLFSNQTLKNSEKIQAFWIDLKN